jgi:hypothetical protein
MDFTQEKHFKTKEKVVKKPREPKHEVILSVQEIIYHNVRLNERCSGSHRATL